MIKFYPKSICDIMSEGFWTGFELFGKSVRWLDKLAGNE